jgi:hypothetical protein
MHAPETPVGIPHDVHEPLRIAEAKLYPVFLEREEILYRFLVRTVRAHAGPLSILCDHFVIFGGVMTASR